MAGDSTRLARRIVVAMPAIRMSRSGVDKKPSARRRCLYSRRGIVECGISALSPRHRESIRARSGHRRTSAGRPSRARPAGHRLRLSPTRPPQALHGDGCVLARRQEPDRSGRAAVETMTTNRLRPRARVGEGAWLLGGTAARPGVGVGGDREGSVDPRATRINRHLLLESSAIAFVAWHPESARSRHGERRTANSAQTRAAFERNHVAMISIGAPDTFDNIAGEGPIRRGKTPLA